MLVLYLSTYIYIYCIIAFVCTNVTSLLEEISPSSDLFLEILLTHFNCISNKIFCFSLYQPTPLLLYLSAVFCLAHAFL